MIATSKTKQGGLNRAFPLSTFSLMCCCLKVRPSFPFCACVHTKICQKGKFVQTTVFENTLFFLKRGRLCVRNQKRKFSKTLTFLSASVLYHFYIMLINCLQCNQSSFQSHIAFTNETAEASEKTNTQQQPDGTEEKTRPFR